MQNQVHFDDIYWSEKETRKFILGLLSAIFHVLRS